MTDGLDLKVLTKKVGPLPVGGWLAVGAAGIALGRVWSARTNGKLPASGIGGLAGGSGAVDGSNPAANPADNDTNDAWSRRVITALINEGVEPTAAQRAITDFLMGYPLTVTESLIVDRALLIGGVPPEGVPPATIDNGGGSTPPPSGGGGGSTGGDTGGSTQPYSWSYDAHPEYLDPTLAWVGGPTVGYVDFYKDQTPAVQAYFDSLAVQPTATPYNAQPVSAPLTTPEFDTFYAQQSPDVQAYLRSLSGVA